MTYEQDSVTPKDFSCLGNWQWMNKRKRWIAGKE